MDDVLLVDDDSDMLMSLIRALKGDGLEAKLHAASSEEKALELFNSINPSVAVIDLCIDEKKGVESGFSLLQKLLEISQSLRVIVLTGHSSVSHGVRAIELGAANFLEKPAKVEHLKVLIEDAIKQSKLRAELFSLREEARSNIADRIVGDSTGALKLKEAIQYASSNPQPVLLTGETGVGKGLCAQVIHNLSIRKKYQFVSYQPAYGGGDLIRSDLFGHIKGAFTGATEDRAGLFKKADKGTLFLDEVDELPIETQVSLLSVLQDKKTKAIGSDNFYSSDFRLITATNGDPLQAIEKGKLRKDFFHRIGHCHIHIPPLRERISDIPILVSHILDELSERENLSRFFVTDEAIASLSFHSWPGNIRELIAVVEGGAYRAEFLGKKSIDKEDLSLNNGRESERLVGSFHQQVENFKRKLIFDSLNRNSGNQMQASKELGLDRSSMRRFLVRQGNINNS